MTIDRDEILGTDTVRDALKTKTNDNFEETYSVSNDVETAKLPFATLTLKVEDQDVKIAATAAEAAAAAASAAAALVSEDNAAASETNAATSETNAAASAAAASALAYPLSSRAGLRALPGPFIDGQRMTVTGYYAEGDAPIKDFYWVDGSVKVDNGYNVFEVTLDATGRFEADDVGEINLLDWGVNPSVADNSTLLQSVATYAGDRPEGEFGGSTLRLPENTIIPYTTGLVLPKGVELKGENKLTSILFYKGAGIAVTANKSNIYIERLHVTSLDPETADFLVAANVGTGSGSCGILLNNVSSVIKDCAITYFNDPALYAAAIKSDGGQCFSNTIKDNYIRYCWGGIEMKDTITDLVISDNAIISVEKYAISIGYDWAAAAVGTFVGDNFRIENNVINNVNLNESPGGGVGAGYGIYVASAATVNIEGNYIEDVYAEVGSTSHSILVGSDVGSKCLNIIINNNNAISAFTGTKYSLLIEKAWYFQGSGNHFDDFDGAVTCTVDALYGFFGINFFTGAPALPYSIAGSSTHVYDVINKIIIGTNRITLDFPITVKSLKSPNAPFAWVTYQDTGAAIVLLDSYNVSGIAWNSVGDHTISFASAAPDADYGIAGTANNTFVGLKLDSAAQAVVGSVRVTVEDYLGVRTAKNRITVIVYSSTV